MGANPFDPKKIAAEVKWLKANPQFDEKPASIREFIGPDYLNIEALVRPGLVEALIDVFGEEVNPNRIANYERAMFTGAIGVGKTTFSSIALCYMAHWLLCMKDPQKFFSLLPGSRIALMQMSTSAKQALEVVFGDLFARIKHSPWFSQNYPFDEKFTKQIRFPQKDIWILPGDSQETSFEGYNILAGILDEMDSHKITDKMDYADVGYETIHSRIASRFTEFGDEGQEAGHKGLLLCVGQMKKSVGFAARKYKDFLHDPRAKVIRMTIWESLGWDKFTRKDGTRASFWYDTKTKKVVPSTLVGIIENPNLIEIPNAYEKDFSNNPEKALKDLAGIPPAVNSPFISQVDKIEACRERWIERFDQTSPVLPANDQIIFEPWFKPNGSDPRKRVLHIDFALSQDAMGICMGYVDHMLEVDGESKPYIVIDFIARLKAPPGMQIIYGDVRRKIYELRDDRKFRLKTVTMDGFQSSDTLQQLRKKKFFVEQLSMDKSKLGYEDLREAIYEERLEFPPYMTYIRHGDPTQVEIAVQELMTLQDMGRKIDHPPDGSKDVADGLAGVVTTLMGDRSYSRGVSSARSMSESDFSQLQPTGTAGFPSNVIPLSAGSWGGLQAPPLPAAPPGYGITIPERLRPRREQ